MSHASGKVKFEDGTILHFEYDGTSDIVCNCLYHSQEEMSNNWRKRPRNICTCGKDESVEIATIYGQ